MYDTIQRTIAAWAFNHYIAYYYFDNVNVNQLKVAFERGEVELENLPIKRDALKHLNLPMEVVSGVVGRLSIKVPLLTLLTDPWVIKITKLMLVVEPKEKANNKKDGNAAQEASTSSSSSTVSEAAVVAAAAAAENLASELNDQSQLDILHETNNSSCADNTDCPSILDESSSSSMIETGTVNSEETKLAEFYSSFSATVSAMVKDIYKNIRLEVESMTILFEEFHYGLVKFNVDSLLLHRPKSARKLSMNNVSVDLAHSGLPSLKKGDLLRIKFESGNLDILDEASSSMQLIAVQQEAIQQNMQPNGSSEERASHSETRVDGCLETVSIVQLIGSNRCAFDRNDQSNASNCSNDFYGDEFYSVRGILNCDKLNIELKLNNNFDEDLSKFSEKNLHIKLDLIGMQYIHSQRIYEIMTQRLMNLLRFLIGLKSGKGSDKTQLVANRKSDNDSRTPVTKSDDTNFNKLLVINVEEGLVYIVDETPNSCVVPVLEFSLDDCRILQFSGEHQQNGFVFAKIGCSHFNREVSTWDTLLEPWPFNLSWDFKTVSSNLGKLVKHKKISLNSDEQANFVVSSAFLDLYDVSLKRILDSLIRPKISPYSSTLSIQNTITDEFNSIFVLHNETGHRLKIAPLERGEDYSELANVHDSLRSSPTGFGGDELSSVVLHKLSIRSRSSAESRDSPDLDRLARWTTVDIGETISFEYETFPIYKRRVSDARSSSRSLLVRVEGWKTLAPIPINKTGQFYREARSDRVMFEDTYVMISIDLEKNSARKLISVRSPLNLVNSLDLTLEIHFRKFKQALYIKPNNLLSVPLPLLHDRMHIRPCNAGVTMSEKAITWDKIKQITDSQSEIVSCRPITVTNPKHESYSSSQSFRICLSIKREAICTEEPSSDDAMTEPIAIPVFTLEFIPPLTIVNLLPCQLTYSLEDQECCLSKGSQQKIHLVDTSKITRLHFKLNDFPESKSLRIDPGATGSFSHTLEMFDGMNRTLHLKADIILVSTGEKPAVQVVIYAPFWFINKTRLPIIFKQEGAVLEAAGQSHEHEESAQSILLFSFYDMELEPPWLCSMRLGKSKGQSMWCEGFKLEKGSGERRLCFVSNKKDKNPVMSKSLIDIDIRRGFGHYSKTTVVTLTARYGFDPQTKTPKKSSLPSPHNYKLTTYNQGVNLAEKIAGRAVSLFSEHAPRKGTSEISLRAPGFKVSLVNNQREKLLEGSVKEIDLNFSTKAKEQIFNFSIQDVRVENALPDCERSIVLDRAQPTDTNESLSVKPALRLIMDRVVGNSFGITLFKQVQVSMCELVLNIEEKLVLKLVEFINFRSCQRQRDSNDLGRDLDKILHPDEDRLSKYYFDLFSIDLSSLKLSVLTSASLPNSLQKLKSYLGLKFFGFEDAQVQLASYVKMNVSKTFKDVFDSVTRFYKRQILEQAPRIVGQQIQNYFRFHLSDLLSTLYDEVYNKLFN